MADFANFCFKLKVGALAVQKQGFRLCLNNSGSVLGFFGKLTSLGFLCLLCYVLNKDHKIKPTMNFFWFSWFLNERNSSMLCLCTVFKLILSLHLDKNLCVILFIIWLNLICSSINFGSKSRALHVSFQGQFCLRYTKYVFDI